jgi:phosphatidylserine/phosphatidylglycerophosphate/cardiolipin synthase-like enzyme
MQERLLRAVISFVGDIPASLAFKLADSMEANGEHSSHLIHQQALRCRFLEILRIASEENIGMQSLSLCIRSSAMAFGERKRDQVQVVWTGPEIPHGGMPSRQTGQILLSLLADAKQEVVLAAFAIYKSPGLQEALENAIQRGVKLKFIVEPQKGGEDHFISDLTKALGKKVLQCSDIYFWKRDPRDPHAVMHVKCVIVDREKLFVSSANLTKNALKENMELGILLNDAQSAKMVSSHFEQLIAAEILFPFDIGSI